MRKIKVYLDTSVISYLDQDDAPEKTKETQKLWERFEDSEYDVYLSQITLNEVEQCPEPKRSLLYDYLGKIAFTILEVDEESIEIAQRIVDLGILKAKSFDDCQHIAIAVVNDCDIVLSWNFKHMVNIKTIRGVRAITNLEGYKDIEIVSPSVLLEGEDDYE